MTFPISIKIGWKIYQFSVALLYINKRIDRYKILSKKKSIIVESNRPFFRNKGLKYRKVTWIVIDGKVENNQAYAATLGAIVKYMDTYEKTA